MKKIILLLGMFTLLVGPLNVKAQDVFNFTLANQTESNAFVATLPAGFSKTGTITSEQWGGTYGVKIATNSSLNYAATGLTAGNYQLVAIVMIQNISNLAWYQGQGLTSTASALNSSGTSGSYVTYTSSTMALGAGDFTFNIGRNATGGQMYVKAWKLTKLVASSAKDMTSFTLPNQTGPATIDVGAKTVSIEIPNGAPKTSLIPTIGVSANATVSPLSGVAQNFSSPVVYTVTAQDASTQAWTVTVTNAAGLSDAKDITSFSLPTQTGSATINAVAKTVAIEVAFGTNLTSLSPTIGVSAAATVNPLSGAATNFSGGPVNYTVTAQDASQQVWAVTVTASPFVFQFNIANATDATNFISAAIPAGGFDTSGGVTAGLYGGTNALKMDATSAISYTVAGAAAGTYQFDAEIINQTASSEWRMGLSSFNPYTTAGNSNSTLSTITTFASVSTTGNTTFVIERNGSSPGTQFFVKSWKATYLGPITTWTGGTSTAWTDASNWSNGVPTSNSTVVIGTTGSFQPAIATDVTILSLTINSGNTLSVSSLANLTVTGVIDNSGILNIANNANLIQTNNTVNTGSGVTNVSRNSNALSRFDSTAWSSPVTGSQTLAAFSPKTSQSANRFYTYDTANSQYDNTNNPVSDVFSKAQGYLIRMPNDAVANPATETFTGVFTGLPNNGTITKAVVVTGNAFNLLGNPYPSTIDADAFIAANSTKIGASLYFFRKVNQAPTSAYAVYNSAGSTATASSEIPSGKIQVGQGFFVLATSASTVTFTNAIRVADNANQFFKTKNVDPKDRVWLNLTNTSGAFSQALVSYMADGAVGVDALDAKYFNDSPIALTSNINNEEYTIQARPVFDATDVVALNFKTDVAGDYTIALDHADGVFATGQEVYLVDSATGTETNLNTNAYTFAATTGTANARFSLKYQKTLKVDANSFNDNSVSVYSNNGTIYVYSGTAVINNIEVYDIQGRVIAVQKNVKATTASIKNLKANNQVLIVKVSSEDNKVVSKKVVN